MDAKSIIELVAAGCLLPYLCWLVWRLIIKQQTSNDNAQTRANEFNKQMASIIESLAKRLDKQDEQLDLLRQTVENTSTAKQAAIEHNVTATETSQKLIELNTKALIELRSDYLKSWSDALTQMNTARGAIVTDVKKHIDDATVITSGAIGAAQTEATRQHTGQSEEITAKMNELQHALEQNGKDTRAKVDDVLAKLESISITIVEMQSDLKTQGQESGAQKAVFDAMAVKLDSLVTTVDNIKKELQPPAAPAPTLPPVDPLAAPGKAEEMK